MLHNYYVRNYVIWLLIVLKQKTNTLQIKNKNQVQKTRYETYFSYT